MSASSLPWQFSEAETLRNSTEFYWLKVRSLLHVKAHLRNGTAGKLIKLQEKRKKSKQKMAIEFFTRLSGDLIHLLKTVHSQCIKYDEFGFNTIFKKKESSFTKGEQVG